MMAYRGAQMREAAWISSRCNIFSASRRRATSPAPRGQLNIVQPALSMQIAKLEKSLDKKLFYRAPRGMSLTSAGEALAQRIAPILTEIDRVRDEIAQLDGKVSGRVNIGMITSAAQSTLPASSAKIAARYPQIHLLVCEGYSETMLEWVGAGQLDIAIVNTPAPRLPPTARHILDEEMMLAYGASNKVALPKVVSFDRIDSLDIVIPSRRHGCGASWTMRWLMRASA
jgi:LysR family nitrogen assimilation transcriptional regulator